MFFFFFTKNKYPILLENNDFTKLSTIGATKGSRKKLNVIDKKTKELAMFKYQGEGYECSESCSEKMSYEIAKILGYPCAKIELAKDEQGTLGVLNYLFVDENSTSKANEHIDAVGYLNVYNENREDYYKISNIKKCLDALDKSLFSDFVRIMFFDALVGETDRHEENWGIIKTKDSYKISPLYDNGCNLLKDFKKESFINQFIDGTKDFDAYIKRSQTWIYKENEKKKYKHFELIKYLKDLYPSVIKKEINNLQKLTDEIIEDIVDKIPDELLTRKHREYIIIYLKKRRDILLELK